MKGLRWAVAYGAVSIATTLCTKALITGFAFSHLPTLMFLERVLVASSLLLTPSPKCSFAILAASLWPLALLSIANALLAVASLEGLNVAMYNALKRLTSLVTLIAEFVILGTRSSRQIELAVLLIAGGALIAGLSDYHFDPFTYTLALGSCGLNSLYLTHVKKYSTQFSEEEILFVNSVLPILPMTLWILFSGEASEVLSYPHLWNPRFLATLAISCTSGSLLGYTQCRCTAATSALTTTVVGQTKMILSSILGLIAFPTKLHPVQIVGILVNSVGAAYFAWRKHYEGKQRDEKKS